MPLLKSQKNAFLLAIRDGDMNPDEFSYSEDDKETTWIRHSSSESFFSVYINTKTGPSNAFNCFYSPGLAMANDTRYATNWDSTFALFQQWLGYVQRETSQPDLWEALAQSHLPGTLPEDNRPFIDPERQAIKERLGQIRDYAYRVLPSLSEQPELGRRLEAKIDYLTESSERMGRKDWYNIFIGTIVSYIFTSTMDSAAAQDFLEFAWRTIHQVLPSLPN